MERGNRSRSWRCRSCWKRLLQVFYRCSGQRCSGALPLSSPDVPATHFSPSLSCFRHMHEVPTLGRYRR